jgi:hypothetical protein
MVGAEGHTLSAVYREFEREGISTPAGGKRWDQTFFRLAILDDAYRPHTHDEVAERVAPEVAAARPRRPLRPVDLQPGAHPDPAGIRAHG